MYIRSKSEMNVVKRDPEELTVGEIIHDLRNPLHILSMKLETLRLYVGHSKKSEVSMSYLHCLDTMGDQVNQIDNVLTRLAEALSTTVSALGNSGVSEGGKRNERRAHTGS